MGKRVLSVWFPRLASERVLRRRPQAGPFALSLRLGNADHLHCLNPAAAAVGLTRGMALADARAICRNLATHPADLGRDAAFLVGLSRWAGRYSPMVAREGADGLVAEITGVAHLFGGEAGLCADMAARLARAGISAVIGIADTRGAAFALARHGGGVALAGQMASAIGRLPIAGLRVDQATAAGLDRLGLRCIRDLTQVPRAPLARRFGPGLMLRLDQALGAQAEPISPDAVPAPYAVRLTLPDPIGLVSDVTAGLARLLARLCVRLEAECIGARRLRLEMRRVDGQAALAEIGLARPMRDPERLLALFGHAIGEVDAGYGIDMLRLTAPVVEPLAPRQIGTAGEIAGEKLTDLITRLGNRLGFEGVQRLHPAESHLPEKSFLRLQAAYAEAAPAWPGGPERPLVIFAPEPVDGGGDPAFGPPKRFRWRRMQLTVARSTGPERIAPEWWLDDPAWRSGLRDYWKVETHEGARLWLFHTPQAPGWSVHGTFA